MSHFIRHFVMLSGLSLFILNVQAGEPNFPARLALVIGNAAYAEKPLKNPVNDAKDMAKVLEGLGFQVILKTDINLRTMRDAVREFEGSLSNGSVSLFYFSGHGNQYNGNNYIIPLGSKISEERDFQYETLSVRDILEIIETKNKDGVNIVILDACRSNPFGGKRFKSGGTSNGLALMGSPSGSLIAYATAPNEVADDNPAERNGIYTKHLLGLLREAPQENILTLFTRVRQQVFKETQGKQIPREENSLMVSEFCLAVTGCERMAIQPAVKASKSISSQLSKVESENLPPAVGEVFQDKLKDGQPCSFCPKMVMVPAGRFKMGDISGTGFEDEQPVHDVTIAKPFAIGVYEVIFTEYDKFATDTGSDKPDDEDWGRGNRPVINVSWDDAVAYADWLSTQTGRTYRLPTEAEWEYASRAETKTIYWWGNEIWSNRANCKSCGSQWDNKSTAPVGSFEVNPFGLYDTMGNVWEWTCSEYEGKYNGKELECMDKNHVNESSVLVIRGGSWAYNPRRVRASDHYKLIHAHRTAYVGLRLVRE